MGFIEDATEYEEIIAQLERAKALGVTVYIDNDHVSAYDREPEEGGTGDSIVAVHPVDLMQALLRHFGVQYDSV